MKNWKAILGITLVFLLGVAAGSLGTIQVARHKFRDNPGPFIREQIFRRMAAELELDNTQRRQLRQIMIETQTELRDARKQFDPQMREILRRMDDKVRAILVNSQRARYNELVRDRRRMLEKFDQGPVFDRPRRTGSTNEPTRMNRPDLPQQPDPSQPAP